MTRICISLILICITGISIRAQQPDAFTASLGAHVQKLARENDLSGVVLVEKDDKIIFLEAYGYANRAEKISNNTETLFNIASMGKMFTGMAIMQLLEAGQITMDDKVGEHLPGFSSGSIRDSVTIRHLLTHTSGIGNSWHLLTDGKKQVLIRKLSEFEQYDIGPLLFSPGSQFSYSNDGFAILGLIIEKITGMDYDDYVRERIFKPLEMTRTDFYEMDHSITNLAMGYTMSVEKPGQWLNNIFVTGIKGTPAGGAYATAGDLLKFARAIRQHSLINRETTRLYTEGIVAYHKGKYAHGVSESMINGHRVIGHGGGHYGVACELQIFTDLGYTVIILTNGEVENFWDVSNFIQRRLAGETPYLKSYEHTKTVAGEVINRGYDSGAKLMKSHPEIPLREYLIERLGYGQLFYGKNQQALDLFRLNTVASPDSPTAWLNLAEACRITNRNSDALVHYKKYLEFEPGDEAVKARIKSLSGK